MAAIDDLNAAVVALKDEVTAIGTEMDNNFAALNAALANVGVNNDPAIVAATTSIQESIDALKAAGARDLPAAPATPGP